jgi:hypothetical protein
MLKLKSYIVILLTILFLLDVSDTKAQSEESYKILFIGSSYFNFNDLPNLFKNFSSRLGKEILIERQIANGLYLEDHAKSNFTDAKIKEQDWDFVIIQGVGVLAAYPDIFNDHPIFPSLQILSNKIEANFETSKIIFCMPWAFEDGMTWKQGWDDDFDAMQAKIYANTIRYSDEIGYTIAPVGWAWSKILTEKNYPLHYLHMSDWNHPNEKGTYLMACVLYATIYQESASGNSFYSSISAEEAQHFQELASKIVLENLSLWNITPIQVGINEVVSLSKLELSQNFPNPFHTNTRIEYEIPKYGMVKIEIFDGFGKEVKTLVNEYKQSGIHQLNLNSATMNSGMYYYRLKNGNQVRTKKMTIVR